MARKKRSTAENKRLREEALRPCSLLGYDHEALALHLIERGAHPMAEPLLRRSIWLNPFEPRFKRELAACLRGMRREREAREWLLAALGQARAQPAARSSPGANT